MVQVLGFLLSAVAASSELQDDLSLLQAGKHRKSVSRHLWEKDLVSFDDYDCTSLLKSKVWCPTSYLTTLAETHEKDKALVLETIEDLENMVNSSRSEHGIVMTLNEAKEAVAKVKSDMQQACDDFDEQATKLERDISELTTQLATARDLSLKAVCILDPNFCKARASLVQGGTHWNLFDWIDGAVKDVGNAVEDAAKGVKDWFDEASCDVGTVVMSDRVCYKRVEAERKKYKDAINALQNRANSLEDELSTMSDNKKAHDDLEHFRNAFMELSEEHENQLDSLANALKTLQLTLLKFYDAVGKDVFDAMLDVNPYVEIVGDADSSKGYYCKDTPLAYLYNHDLEACKAACSETQECKFISHFADNGCHTYKECDELVPSPLHWSSGTTFRRVGAQ